MLILNLSPDLITCWHYYPTKLDEQLPDNITVVSLDLFDPRTFIEDFKSEREALDALTVGKANIINLDSNF